MYLSTRTTTKRNERLAKEIDEYYNRYMQQPFKIGDRIREINSFAPIAVVTEYTEQGFKYEYEEVWHMHPRLGLSYTGGEVY